MKGGVGERKSRIETQLTNSWILGFIVFIQMFTEAKHVRMILL